MTGICFSATDEEDWSNDYPITHRYWDLFHDIVQKWRVTPLPAFDAKKNFIKIHDLESSLRGSLVLVYFDLKHYSIKDKRTDGIASNTFSATVTQVTILERGSDQRRSPYKSQLLKGPTFLPQSPPKKSDQVNAVKAFHPGKKWVFSRPSRLLIVHFTTPHTQLVPECHSR
jgi:hypothetical protein